MVEQQLVEEEEQKVIMVDRRPAEKKEEDLSDGSHGELSDTAINERHDAMPDDFPWSKESQANYIR